MSFDHWRYLCPFEGCWKNSCSEGEMGEFSYDSGERDVLVVARYPVSPSEYARYIYLIMSIAFIIRFLNK
jgi:hypothetical protein